jgi:hypothetical protein
MKLLGLLLTVALYSNGRATHTALRRRADFALTATFAPSVAQETRPPEFSAKEPARRTLERRAVDAAIWGMPIVFAGDASDRVRAGTIDHSRLQRFPGRRE